MDFEIVCMCSRVNGEDVRLMLWDTAGQEEFDAITKAYYRGANAGMFLFRCRLVFYCKMRGIDVWSVLQGLRPVFWCSPPPTETRLRPSAAGGRRWRWRWATFPPSWCRTKSICWTTRLSRSKNQSSVMHFNAFLLGIDVKNFCFVASVKRLKVLLRGWSWDSIGHRWRKISTSMKVRDTAVQFAKLIVLYCKITHFICCSF